MTSSISEPGLAARQPAESALFEYLLRLGDSTLILSQRLGAWCGHGPALEEDLGLTNVALDLLGQARLWLTLAGEVEGKGRDEDQLAYFRDAGEFRNLLLVEQPNGNYADTMARQFYFDIWNYFLLGDLSASRDPRVAEIAAKAVKEATYHARRSGEWVVRLGDGTELSQRRMQAALDELWRFTGEMFAMDDIDRALLAEGIGCDHEALQPRWHAHVAEVLAEARLQMPSGGFMQGGGKRGVHTEHLGYILAEMQVLQRTYPGQRW